MLIPNFSQVKHLFLLVLGKPVSSLSQSPARSRTRKLTRAQEFRATPQRFDGIRRVAVLVWLS